jgi:hypothetical protein
MHDDRKRQPADKARIHRALEKFQLGYWLSRVPVAAPSPRENATDTTMGTGGTNSSTTLKVYSRHKAGAFRIYPSTTIPFVRSNSRLARNMQTDISDAAYIGKRE